MTCVSLPCDTGPCSFNIISQNGFSTLDAFSSNQSRSDTLLHPTNSNKIIIFSTHNQRPTRITMAVPAAEPSTLLLRPIGRPSRPRRRKRRDTITMANHPTTTTTMNFSRGHSSSNLKTAAALLVVLLLLQCVQHTGGAVVPGTTTISAAAPPPRAAPLDRRTRRQAGTSWRPVPPLRTISTASVATRHATASPSSASTRSSLASPPPPASSSPSSSSAWLDGCKSALSSALAAACVKALLQPIDALKTYQQHTYAASGTSVSLTKAFQGIASRGSWTHFYAGLGVTVIGAMPGVALYFGVYSYCKRKLLTAPEPFGPSHPTLCVAVSAALGNTIASFSRVPYEVVKQQLQTGLYTSTRHALTSIATSGQAWQMAFPKGSIAVQMFRDIPYAIVSLVLYESLQSAVKRHHQRPMTAVQGGVVTNVHNAVSQRRHRRQKILDFAVGGIAGGMGSWVTNPMDVVKTRLQTDGLGAASLYGGSVVQCAHALWIEGGPAAFLRGSVPRLLHKVPANAFFFLFYEVFRRVLRVSDASSSGHLATTAASSSGGGGTSVRRSTTAQASPRPIERRLPQ